MQQRDSMLHRMTCLHQQYTRLSCQQVRECKWVKSYDEQSQEDYEGQPWRKRTHQENYAGIDTKIQRIKLKQEKAEAKDAHIVESLKRQAEDVQEGERKTIYEGCISGTQKADVTRTSNDRRRGHKKGPTFNHSTRQMSIISQPCCQKEVEKGLVRIQQIKILPELNQQQATQQL